MATTSFEIGAWVETFEGIAQVLYVRENFVEKYTPEFCDGGKVGAYLFDMLVCKLLCNFDGKIRKKNRTTALRSDYCKSADAESMAMVESIKKNFPDDYRNFVVGDERADVGDSVLICFNVREDAIAGLHEEIDAINCALGKSFTISEFVDMAKDRKIALDFTQVKPHTAGASVNFAVVLFNRLYKTVGKNRIYSRVWSRDYLSPKDSMNKSVSE